MHINTKIGESSKCYSKDMRCTKTTSAAKIYWESTFMDIKIYPEKFIINIKFKNPVPWNKYIL